MKNRKLLVLASLALLSTISNRLPTAFAQGTAFTYQGQLNVAGGPANGNYDLAFGLFSASSGGAPLTTVLTNPATPISNGLFTVALDFGNQFPGAERWLEVSVRTNGNGTFATLSPRQLLTSTPYAVQAANAFSASSVPAGSIVGTIPLTELPASLVTNGATGVNFTGTFTGNGANVTNVALTSLNSQGFFNWQGTFLPTVPPVIDPECFSVVATNIAGGGPAELVCANTLSNSVDVFTNNGSAGFGLVTSVPVGPEPVWLAVADLNGDGKLDVVASSFETNILTVLTNDGHGGLVFSSSLTVQTMQFCVVAADINGDGKPDLIAANTATNTLSILTNNGSGGFVLSSTLVVGNEPAQVVAVDINGDNKLDLICGNAKDSTVSLMTNNGSGGFALATNLPTGSTPSALAVVDINGDGKLDLICANEGDNTLSVYTNNGSGGFVVASTNAVGTTPVSIQAVDLKGDGKLELVCGDQDGSILVLTNNGAGGLAIASTNTVETGPLLGEGLAFADINGDGKPDLICSDPFDQTIWLLINSPTYYGAFTGNGSGLTSLTASNITGILPESALKGTYSNVVTFNNATGNFSGGFSGDGSGLGNLNASQLMSGTVPDSALGGVYTNYFDFYNDNNDFFGNFAGDGSDLFHLNASQITSGTVPGSALNGADGSGLVNLSFSQLTGGTVSGSALAGTYGNAVTFNNPSDTFTGKFIGNGGGLTNLNASQLTNVIPNSALAGVYSAAVTFSNPGDLFTGNGSGLTSLSASQLTSGPVPGALTLSNAANILAGNGNGLTSLNATQLTSGTVPDARLSTNVALRSGPNTFSGNQIVTNGNVGIGTSTPGLNNLEINPTFESANGYGLVVCKTNFGENIQVDEPAGGGGIGLAVDDAAAGDSSTTLLMVRNNVAAASQTLFDVLGSGNVGIGTTSPQQLLQVGDPTVLGSQGMIRVASRANGGSAARAWDFGCPIDATNASDTSGKNFSFVIQDTASAAPNLLIRWDTHYVGIGTTNPTAPLTVGAATCDGNSWLDTSDRNAKDDFSAVDPLEVLAKVAALPMTEWQYKTTPGLTHLGPMAQDFHAAFGLNGSDDKHIATVDEGGVALAAIQGLDAKVNDRVKALEAENADLKARLEKLEQIINARKGNE